MQRLVSSTSALVGAFSATVASSTAAEQKRFMHKGEFKAPERMRRLRNSNLTTTQWNTNKYGGRFARLRESRATYRRAVASREFSRDPRIVQFNMDVWNAQQTLRKKWKGRDWEVVELPYELAPKVLQKVIPEMYTAPPMHADPAAGDFSNIRAKVFDREDLQEVLFTDVAGRRARGENVDPSSVVLPYPNLLRVDKKAMTLDKFL